jgi:cytochrome b involved in lipid metabolism
MSKTFSAADVASHSKPDSLYIIVDEDVYDVTQFQDEHPGKQWKKRVDSREILTNTQVARRVSL